MRKSRTFGVGRRQGGSKASLTRQYKNKHSFERLRRAQAQSTPDSRWSCPTQSYDHYALTTRNKKAAKHRKDARTIFPKRSLLVRSRYTKVGVHRKRPPPSVLLGRPVPHKTNKLEERGTGHRVLLDPLGEPCLRWRWDILREGFRARILCRDSRVLVLLRCQSAGMAGVGNSGGESKPVRENGTSNHACSSAELFNGRRGRSKGGGTLPGVRAKTGAQ